MPVHVTGGETIDILGGNRYLVKVKSRTEAIFYPLNISSASMMRLHKYKKLWVLSFLPFAIESVGDTCGKSDCCT